MTDKKIKDAINVLRDAMKDKSLGELHYVWMSNIKWAIYDAITEYKDTNNTEHNKKLQEKCEEGANIFLDRLFSEDNTTDNQNKGGEND